MAVNRTQASATVASIGGASFIATGGHKADFAGSVTFAGAGALIGPTHLGLTAASGTDGGISNSSLTVIGNGSIGANTTAVSNASASAGKLYCEFSIDVGAQSLTGVGLCNASQASGTSLSASLNAVGYFADGTVRINSVTVSTLVSFTTGDVIDMAVDLGNSTIWFSKNGAYWNNDSTANPTTNAGGISISSLNAGPYFAAVEVRTSDQITANFILPSMDATTIAWVNKVVVNGGTVSERRTATVNNLITGLKADSIWTLLDRLWLFAGENAGSALTDIVGLASATLVSAPTLTADRGYQSSNGTTSYIDTNITPSTLGGNFAQNSASIFAWNNTAGQNAEGMFGFSNASGLDNIRLYQDYTDTNAYWALNVATGNSEGPTVFSNPAATGLYTISRTGANAEVLDLNGGASSISGTHASAALVSTTTIHVLHANVLGGVQTRQVSCFGVGAGLNSTQIAALYTRLRTYMSTVGVP